MMCAVLNYETATAQYCGEMCVKCVYQCNACTLDLSTAFDCMNNYALRIKLTETELPTE